MHDIELIVFVSLLCLLLAYYIAKWVMFHRTESTYYKPFEGGVSVVIVIRYDTDGLRALLPRLMEQDFDRYEIILVADRSNSGTVGFLRSLQSEYPGMVKLVEIDRDTPYPWPGKKFALTLGVKGASYDRIVSLGVDAKLDSKYWLRSLVAPFSGENIKIIIGRSSVTKPDKLFAKIWYYLSYGAGVSKYVCAWLGLPYAGEINNFAFDKDMFMTGSGYMNYMKVEGGEADFIIQDNVASHRLCLNLSKGSTVRIGHNGTYPSLYRLWQNGLGVFKAYNLKNKILCLILPTIKVLLVIAALILIFRCR